MTLIKMSITSFVLYRTGSQIQKDGYDDDDENCLGARGSKRPDVTLGEGGRDQCEREMA